MKYSTLLLAFGISILLVLKIEAEKKFDERADNFKHEKQFPFINDSHELTFEKSSASKDDNEKLSSVNESKSDKPRREISSAATFSQNKGTSQQGDTSENMQVKTSVSETKISNKSTNEMLDRDNANIHEINAEGYTDKNYTRAPEILQKQLLRSDMAESKDDSTVDEKDSDDLGVHVGKKLSNATQSSSNSSNSLYRTYSHKTGICDNVSGICNPSNGRNSGKDHIGVNQLETTIVNHLAVLQSHSTTQINGYEKECHFERGSGYECDRTDVCCTRDCRYVPKSWNLFCGYGESSCSTEMSFCDGLSSKCPAPYAPSSEVNGRRCWPGTHDGASTCKDGFCNSTVCRDAGLGDCWCDHGRDEECVICCRSNDSICAPAEDFGLKANDSKYFYRHPHTPCHDSGTCTKFGVCSSIKLIASSSSAPNLLCICERNLTGILFVTLSLILRLFSLRLI